MKKNSQQNRFANEVASAQSGGKKQRVSFRSELRHAIRTGMMEVHYQPQINLKDGSSGHFEALIRWNHPTLGSISPASFIPIAEEMGLVDEITRFVIQSVVKNIELWISKEIEVKSVSINISADHFSTEERAEKLMHMLKQKDFPVRYVKLELTETAMLAHTDTAKKYLLELVSMGFAISLDDFGTGYSSVAYLLDFPISEIKIDRSFVKTVTTSLKCQAIIRALIDLAKALSVDIVAEGVEKLEELRILEAMGCAYAQGYLFAKPLAEGHVEHFIGMRQNMGKKDFQSHELAA